MEIRFIHNPYGALLAEIVSLLRDSSIERMRCAISYVQLSGVLYVYDLLKDFHARGGASSVVASVDQSITTYEGLLALLRAGTETYVYRSASHSFHVKTWLFYDSSGPSHAIVGSGNLTRGGLIRNVEIASVLRAITPAGRSKLAELEPILADLESNARDIPDQAALDVAEADFNIPHERTGRRRSPERVPGGSRPSTSSIAPTAPPSLSEAARNLASELVSAATPTPAPGPAPTGSIAATPGEVAGADVERILVVANLLRQPHTPGEFRLPKPALISAPEFWNWPDGFANLSSGSVTFDERRAVCRFRSDGMPDVVESNVKIYYYEEKSEFRITSSEFRARGDAGDIVIFEQSEDPAEDFVITVVRLGEADHASLLGRCTFVMPGGRRWGME